MIADQHRQGMEDLETHRSVLLERHLDDIIAQPTVDKREWLAQVMTAREYAARQCGESTRRRGERRVLQRWVRAGHRFHPRTYLRIMGRSTRQLTMASRMMPWNPEDQPSRPSGRLHGSREMGRSLPRDIDEDEGNDRPPVPTQFTPPPPTVPPRRQSNRTQRKRKRAKPNQEREDHRKRNKRRKASTQRKRKQRGEGENQRSLRHFFQKQCQRK